MWPGGWWSRWRFKPGEWGAWKSPEHGRDCTAPLTASGSGAISWSPVRPDTTSISVSEWPPEPVLGCCDTLLFLFPFPTILPFLSCIAFVPTAASSEQLVLRLCAFLSACAGSLNLRPEVSSSFRLQAAPQTLTSATCRHATGDASRPTTTISIRWPHPRHLLFIYPIAVCELSAPVLLAGS